MDFHSILISTLLLAGVSFSRNSGWQANPHRSRVGGSRFQQSPSFDVSAYLKAPPPPAPKQTTSGPESNIDLVENPIVNLKDGALRGFTMRTVSSRRISAFQGIPFAQPPVGPLRFRDPEKNSPWNGTRDAIAQSPQCIQLNVLRQMELHGQEDCLYINVYAPQAPSLSERRLPVMVWIHGGGFVFGAGSIYGFLTTGDSASPGNQGLKDQTMALRWVKENIAYFGGDPMSVTAVGQSAGGAAIQLHMVSPLSQRLFHKAISQSGSAFSHWVFSLENQVENAKRMAELFNCTTSDSHQMVDCLRQVDASQLPSVQATLADWFVFPFPIFGPCIETDSPGTFLIEPPEETYRKNEAASIPWIVGFTQNEYAWLASILTLQPELIFDVNTNWERIGLPFLTIYNQTGNDVEILRRIWDFYVPGQNFTFETREGFVKMFSDRFIVDGSLKAMRYHSMYTSQPVYAYIFNFEGDYSVVELYGQNPRDWGAAHMDDLIYLLNNTDYYHQLNQSQSDVEELRMSRLMTNIWSNFALMGRPYISTDWSNVDVWEPIPKSTNLFSPLRFLELNLNPKMMDDPLVDRYNFWRGLNLRN